MDEIISQREFARRLGINEKSVRNGIRTGKIFKGIASINVRPAINYPIALNEAIKSALGRNSLMNKILAGTDKRMQAIDKATGKTKAAIDSMKRLSAAMGGTQQMYLKSIIKIK